MSVSFCKSYDVNRDPIITVSPEEVTVDDFKRMKYPLESLSANVVNFYADIDMKIEGLDEAQFNSIRSETNKALSSLKGYCHTDGSYYDSSGKKLSFHVHNNHFQIYKNAFTWESEYGKMVQDTILTNFPDNIKETVRSGFDNSVYGKHKWLRTPYSIYEGKLHPHIPQVDCPIQDYLVNALPNNISVHPLMKKMTQIKIVEQDYKAMATNMTFSDDENITKPRNPLELPKLHALFECIDPEKRAYAYQDWIKLGFLIRGVLGTDGIDTFIEISRKSGYEKFSERNCRAEFNAIQDKNVKMTAGTLVRWAKEDSPDKTKQIMKKSYVEEEEWKGDAPMIPWEDDMNYNHHKVKEYCLTYEEQLTGEINKEKFLKRTFEYVDRFFATVEDENNGIVRERFHVVNGKRRRNAFVRMKNWVGYCLDKSVFSATKTKTDQPVCIWALANWEKYYERRKYQSFNFYPSLEPRPYFNTFNGFAYEDNGEEVKMEVIKPWLDHVKEMVCRNNELVYNHLIKHVASMIQFPWVQLMVALCIRGREGAGKGLFFRVIKLIMGEYDEDSVRSGSFRTVKSQSDVFGQFTSILEGSCCVFLDEMVWGGDKKQAGTLKALITEPTAKIEFKGCTPYIQRAFHQVLMSTNCDWFIPASEEARRFFVLEIDDKWAGSNTAESTAYFDKVANVPIQMLANYLYRVDLTGWNARIFPLTQALLDQKIESMDPTSLWVFNKLKDSEWYDEPVPKGNVFESFLAWLRNSNQYNTNVCDRVFWKRLKEFGVEDKRISIDREQVRHAVFLNLKATQSVFIKKYRMDDNYFVERE